MIAWLNNFSIMQFLHKHADLMSMVLQLKIEQNYWNCLTSMMATSKVYLSDISKDLTMKNSINWDHSRTEEYIERRKNLLEHKLQETEHAFHIHSQQACPFHHPTLDMNAVKYHMDILTTTLTTLVECNLSYLRTNFEQKKTLWQFDINAICLVKSFYDLNPTDHQVRNYSHSSMFQLRSFFRCISLRRSGVRK